MYVKFKYIAKDPHSCQKMLYTFYNTFRLHKHYITIFRSDEPNKIKIFLYKIDLRAFKKLLFYFTQRKVLGLSELRFLTAATLRSCYMEASAGPLANKIL